MHVCTDCGHVGDDDSEFCYRCGSKNGFNIEQKDIPPQFGIADSPRGKIVVKSGIKRAYIAVAAGFISGIFNIFGIGQLILGQYIRFAVYAACSAYYFYEKYTGLFGLDSTGLMIFTVVIFLCQMWGLFTALEKAKRGQ